MLLLILSSTTVVSATGVSGFTVKAGRFFKQFVFEGQVDYHAVQESKNIVNELIRDIENIKLQDESESYWNSTAKIGGHVLAACLPIYGDTKQQLICDVLNN